MPITVHCSIMFILQPLCCFAVKVRKRNSMMPKCKCVCVYVSFFLVKEETFVDFNLKESFISPNPPPALWRDLWPLTSLCRQDPRGGVNWFPLLVCTVSEYFSGVVLVLQSTAALWRQHVLNQLVSSQRSSRNLSDVSEWRNKFLHLTTRTKHTHTVQVSGREPETNWWEQWMTRVSSRSATYRAQNAPRGEDEFSFQINRN